MKGRIVIFVIDGFEESELLLLKDYFESYGWEIEIVSFKGGMIKVWVKFDWGKEYIVDNIFDDVKVIEYDGLLFLGGVMNLDVLWKEDKVFEFVK